VLFPNGVRPQGLDECRDTLGAQVMQVDIDAELQELKADQSVLVEQRLRLARPILGAPVFIGATPRAQPVGPRTARDD
jgi:hypothetical protein